MYSDQFNSVRFDPIDFVVESIIQHSCKCTIHKHEYDAQMIAQFVELVVSYVVRYTIFINSAFCCCCRVVWLIHSLTFFLSFSFTRPYPTLSVCVCVCLRITIENDESLKSGRFFNVSIISISMPSISHLVGIHKSITNQHHHTRLQQLSAQQKIDHFEIRKEREKREYYFNNRQSELNKNKYLHRSSHICMMYVHI